MNRRKTTPFKNTPAAKRHREDRDREKKQRHDFRKAKAALADREAEKGKYIWEDHLAHLNYDKAVRTVMEARAWDPTQLQNS